jgi:hypothetical protein
MERVIPRVIVVLVFLVFVIGLGLIADVDSYDNNVPEERTRNLFNRSQWSNPFAFELTGTNIIILFLTFIATIFLSALIVFSIINWKWVLVLMAVLLIAVLILIIPADFNIIIFSDNRDAEQVEAPEFEGYMEELVEEEEEDEAQEEWIEEEEEEAQEEEEKDDTPFSYKHDEDKDSEDDFYDPPIKDKRQGIDNSVFFIGGLIMVLFVTGSLIFTLLRSKERGKVSTEEEEIDKETLKKFSKSLGITIEALNERGEPREVVILAYSVFLDRMKNVNLYKISSETPFEFAERVFRAFKIRKDDIQTLVSLFEKARYSINPVTDDERSMIIEILNRINQDLIEKYKLMVDSSAEVKDGKV